MPLEGGNPGELCRRVAEICEGAVFPETHLQDQVVSIRRRLAEPLRIAVTGRVAAGKSTTVNALLATQIAPVGRGETTALVCQFSHDEVESVMLALRGGEREEIYLDAGGRLPQELPRPVEEIDHIEVRIPYAPTLRSATLIDTPGISSVRQEGSGRTVELLFSKDSRRAVAGADALVFLLQGQADEAQALAAFQDLAGTSSACCTNAIGVISQADKLGDRNDPMGAAGRIAKRLSTEPALRTRLATVIPLLALIAETVETGTFAREDEIALASLAAEDDDALEDLLASAEDLLEGECCLEPAARQRLIAKLDVYGIRASVQALKAGCRPDDLRDFLYELSGLPALKSLISELFTRRADLLKADQALASLERLTYQATTEASLALRARIEELRLSAPMHAVAEMRALSQHAQGLVQDLPEWLVERLLRVTRETTPAARLGLDVNAGPEAVRAAALEGATLCLTYSNGKAPTIRHRATADTLRRSYELMLTNGLARRAAAIPRITERIRSS
jgi:GTPase Era involved in 16S rRNA processing